MSSLFATCWFCLIIRYLVLLLSLLLGRLLTDIYAVLLLKFIGFLEARCKSTLNKEEINKIK